MKVLIWIGSLFVVHLILVMVNPPVSAYLLSHYYDAALMIWRVGSVLVTEILGIIIAKKLCGVYEKQRLIRKARKEGIAPFEYIKKDVPPMLMERLEKHRGHPDCIKPDIKGYVKRNELSVEQGNILIEEFSKQK